MAEEPRAYYWYEVVEARSLKELAERLNTAQSSDMTVKVVYVEKAEEWDLDRARILYRALVECIRHLTER